MAKKNQPVDLPPQRKDVRSTQPVPSAPPPEANKAPPTPIKETAGVEEEQPQEAASRAGRVQQADVGIGARAGVDPNQTAETTNIPEPLPVVDKLTKVKQARTFIDDAAVVANHRIPPADSAMIDQLLSQKFDEGTIESEELAFDVAQEQNMNPTWDDSQATKTLNIKP